MASHSPLVALQLCAFLCAFALVHVSAEQEPDIHKDTRGLITENGYPFEEHTVETEDGFLLVMHRIPGGNKDNAEKAVEKNEAGDVKAKEVVFLQHGLADSSSQWVINNPRQSLAFILADAGFDVWLGNTRGNQYSHAHKHLTPKDREYWDFSIDTLAEYDLPAEIDYVVNATATSHLAMIGHSLGAAQTFAYLSNDPMKRSARVHQFVSMAPATNMYYTTHTMFRAMSRLKVPSTLWSMGMNSISNDGWSKVMQDTLPFVCKVTPRLCDSLNAAIFGANDGPNINQTRLPVYWGHLPSGAIGLRVLDHLAQLVRERGFRRYDWGKDENLKRYGQVLPPTYVTNFTVPVMFYTGEADVITNQKDMADLKRGLSRVSYQEDIPQYAHMDFSWGMDAHTQVYERVVETLTASSTARARVAKAMKALGEVTKGFGKSPLLFGSILNNDMKAKAAGSDSGKPSLGPNANRA